MNTQAYKHNTMDIKMHPSLKFWVSTLEEYVYVCLIRSKNLDNYGNYGSKNQFLSGFYYKFIKWWSRLD